MAYLFVSIKTEDSNGSFKWWILSNHKYSIINELPQNPVDLSDILLPSI